MNRISVDYLPQSTNAKWWHNLLGIKHEQPKFTLRIKGQQAKITIKRSTEPIIVCEFTGNLSVHTLNSALLDMTSKGTSKNPTDVTVILPHNVRYITQMSGTTGVTVYR